MGSVLKNKILRITLIVVISVLFSIIINRGFLIINSLLVMNIKQFFLLQVYLNLGWDINFNPVLSKIFGNIF